MKSEQHGKFKTVPEYVKSLPAKRKTMFVQLRNAIKQAAPLAEEVISYNMPAFRFHGILVYYASYEKHIGFYPTSSVIKVFADELQNYNTSKGTIQFPVDKKLPVSLIKKIVKYRVKENLEKEKSKKR